MVRDAPTLITARGLAETCRSDEQLAAKLGEGKSAHRPRPGAGEERRTGQSDADPMQLYLADIFTIPANLTGICGISVPCGFVEVDGHRLPIGLQLLGKALDEARIFQIAHAYEQSTEWHKARPPL